VGVRYAGNKECCVALLTCCVDGSMSQVEEERRVVAQLKNEFGDSLGSTFDLPLSVTAATLQQICNALLQQVFTFCCCLFVL